MFADNVKSVNFQAMKCEKRNTRWLKKVSSPCQGFSCLSQLWLVYQSVSVALHLMWISLALILTQPCGLRCTIFDQHDHMRTFRNHSLNTGGGWGRWGSYILENNQRRKNNNAKDLCKQTEDYAMPIVRNEKCYIFSYSFEALVHLLELYSTSLCHRDINIIYFWAILLGQIGSTCYKHP